MTEISTVDIIILSWDRTAETIEAIESVLAQEGVDQHVYVVDQGSKPHGLAQLRSLAARDPRVVIKEMHRNIGVAGGRNVASEMGSGEYIVALDNDAVFSDPGVLFRVVNTFDRDRALGAIAFRILKYHTNTDDDMCWDYPNEMSVFADREFEVTRYVGAGHAVRRNVFYKAGCYDDELFFVGEERDLCYRILNLGYSIKYSPQISVQHKVLPEQRMFWITGRYFYTVRNVLYSDYKYGRSPLYLAKSVAALTLIGVYNKIGLQALSGAKDAFRLARNFRRKNPVSQNYRLSPAVQDHIRQLENMGRPGIFERFFRLFRRLPGKA